VQFVELAKEFQSCIEEGVPPSKIGKRLGLRRNLVNKLAYIFEKPMDGRFTSRFPGGWGEFERRN